MRDTDLCIWIPFPIQRNQESLNKGLIPVLVHGKCPGPSFCTRKSCWILSLLIIGCEQQQYKFTWTTFLVGCSVITSSNQLFLYLLQFLLLFRQFYLLSIPSIHTSLYTKTEKKYMPILYKHTVWTTLYSYYRLPYCVSSVRSRWYQWKIKREGAIGRGSLQTMMQVCGWGRERKDWVGRDSDHGPVLRKSQPGRWKVLKPKYPLKLSHNEQK